MSRHWHIAGAGLAGSLLALLLARRGEQVTVLEKRHDPRQRSYAGGRSINLALAERGLHALRLGGIEDAVEALLIPMHSRMVHNEAGNSQSQPYGTQAHEVIYSIGRGGLNELLIERAVQAGAEFVFDCEVNAIDLDAKTISRECGPNIVFETLIGADGAGSRVRAALETCTGTQSTIDMLDHAYKELELPANADGSHALPSNHLHIWPRHDYMLIALPNLDGSFTVTLFAPQALFAQLGDDVAAIEQFIVEHFPDLAGFANELATSMAENPLGELGTVYCPQWTLDDHCVLIGDAAHAIVPFHGQGMNAAFEDCAALDACLAGEGTMHQQLTEFAKERKPNADAIAQMALENYVEMRSDVATPGYQLRRQLALELDQRFPDRFEPRYAMVMFRRLPYAEALHRGEINRRILHTLTDGKTTLADVDFDHAAQLIHDQLPQINS